jgi:diadenosine tetraphosphatase ApaH/serine/threonine PP2A family protein phosphatase
VKYAIISDVHANLEALGLVLAKIDEAGVDRIICLGDVVGYNANPNECVDLIRERNIPTVCGNHDAAIRGTEEPWGFNPIALSAAMWAREQLSPVNLAWLRALPDSLLLDDFVAAHGSPVDRDAYLFTWEDAQPQVPAVAELDRDLCFFGHTHCPGIFSADGMYAVDADSRFELGEGKVFLINVGSVGQPRDGDPRAAFGLYDSEARVYEQVRVAYPVEETARRVLEAGLPGFLAERLFLGR